VTNVAPDPQEADLSDEQHALRVTNLHKSFHATAVLRGVELTLDRGELCGIIGENGAGKSTLLRILAGEMAPDRGEIVYTGTLGYCPQNSVLNEELTVEQHLQFFRRAYQVPGLSRARELLARLGFERYLRTRAGLLSGGTRQKLNLTLALMHEPDVVLMDEPYQGFDWENYLNFWSIAEELRRRGTAVLVISHIAHDTAHFDRLYRLRDGVLVASEVNEEVVEA
jgi:ABC-2 type transport system ATP-binding protein